jgi:hypothetical protein
VPRPPHRTVVPLREGLLHPLHYVGKLEPIFRLDIKREQIALKTQALNLEGKPKFRLVEHLLKNLPGRILAKQGFPVVDLGADFVPHTLLEFSQLSHINNRGLTRRFASIGPQKNYKKQEKQGEMSLQAAS